MDYSQPYGAAAGAAYVNGNPAAGIAGSIPPAGAMEYPQREILAVIAAAGFTPSNGDLTQLLKAIRVLIGQPVIYVSDIGTANALAGSASPAISAYGTGQIFLVHKSAAANTGPTTLNVSGIAPLALVRRDGNAVQGGDLAGSSLFLCALDPANVLRLLSPVTSEIVSVAKARTLVSYTAAGTYTWTCPAGVYFINVLAIGGGCSGAAGTTSVGGGGGGAGGSAEGLVSVIPGTAYTIVVGAGGARQTSLGSGGLPGSASAFATVIYAPGAPSIFAGIPTGSQGGAAGTGGLINLSGSSGGDGTPYNSYLGGYGGASRLGGGGRPGTGGGGTGGEASGSGGGGSYGTSPGPSGNGADGCVLITY